MECPGVKPTPDVFDDRYVPPSPVPVRRSVSETPETVYATVAPPVVIVASFTLLDAGSYVPTTHVSDAEPALLSVTVPAK